jgi:hypothetical protein
MIASSLSPGAAEHPPRIGGSFQGSQRALGMRARARVRAALYSMLLVAAVGCGGRGADSHDGEAQVRAAAVHYPDAFERIATLVPEQSEQAPIVRLSGIDIRSDGAFLIADVSESHVQMFDPGGRRLARIGRRGAGPGEFQSPRFPRFGPDGRVYVADAQNPRIQSFDEGGNYLSEIRLDVSRIQGFEVLEDGSFVVLAQHDQSENLLLHLDPAGTVRSAGLPIAGILPEGEADHPIWPTVRSFFLAMKGDTAFVSSTVSNRVWQVHLPSGAVQTTVLNFEGYSPPRIDHANPPRDPREVQAWTRSVFMSSKLSVGADEVHLPFVRGVLNYGDPMILLSRSRAGEWHALSGAPPVVAAYGDSVITIEDPEADFLTLGVYRRRRSDR